MNRNWDRYEPASVKRTIPMEWAVGYLFGVWGAGAEMIPCPLPGHQDDTASFNLWAEDGDGLPQRYGCFGCGSNGDVVDLIREARGVGFLEACRLAVEELEPALTSSSWTPAERPPVFRSPARGSAELEDVLTRLAPAHRPDDLAQFVAAKHMLSVPASYLQGEWEWGTFRTPAPTIYFPHRGWDDQLTGIRFRSIRRGTRWTEGGSRFPALYGAWRDESNPEVLLCEGETDTVWAAWSLDAAAELSIDVLGLATGAAQKPPEEAIRQLAGRRVFLAFDADVAGRLATNRWREALNGRPYTDVKVVPVPDGHDVLSCGVPVPELIAEAE